MKNYYKFRIETVNKENEVIDIIECKTKKEVKNVINCFNFSSHYRTVKTKNNKIVKSLSKLYKIEIFTF